ncbi:MAG: LysM peptidoglycan-binding domain-containing protein [Candidatus Ancaeobacter aquaticus]|nr:LysM peptidoglycan-binding domain-containing protein [Candidatus Ancaeobacter aquaticus]
MLKYILSILLLLVFVTHACGMTKKPEGRTMSRKQQEKLKKAKKELYEYPKASAVVADKFYEQGQFFEEEGLYDEAIAQYKHALALKPPFSDMVHYTLGILYYNHDLLELAADHLYKSIILNPDNVQTHYWFGLTLAELREYREAIQEFETVISINPHFYECYYWIALIYEKTMTNNVKAVDFYRKYLMLDPRGKKADAARTSLENLGAEQTIAPVKQLPPPIIDTAPISLDEYEKTISQPSTDIEEETVELAPVPSPAPAIKKGEVSIATPPIVIGDKTHTAQEGETLRIIAGYDEIYNDSTKWRTLRDANKNVLDNSLDIEPGTVLRIPKIDTVALNKNVSDPSIQSYHTISKGETLWIIAGYDEIYNDDTKWPLLYSANKDTLEGKKTNLHEGIVITVPKPTEAALKTIEKKKIIEKKKKTLSLPEPQKLFKKVTDAISSAAKAVVTAIPKLTEKKMTLVENKIKKEPAKIPTTTKTIVPKSTPKPVTPVISKKAAQTPIVNTKKKETYTINEFIESTQVKEAPSTINKPIQRKSITPTKALKKTPKKKTVITKKPVQKTRITPARKPVKKTTEKLPSKKIRKPQKATPRYTIKKKTSSQSTRTTFVEKTLQEKQKVVHSKQRKVKPKVKARIKIKAITSDDNGNTIKITTFGPKGKIKEEIVTDTNESTKK